MNPGESTRRIMRLLAILWAAVMIALAPQAALAQNEDLSAPPELVAPPPAPTDPEQLEAIPADVAADASSEDVAPGADAYTPLGPDMIKGQPVNGGLTFQDQYSPTGDYALWVHDVVLLPLVVAICLFVLGLLLWVIARYRRRENVAPSRTSHNTMIEVIWTLVPVIILVAIAIPSITLLARQYESPPADAVTIKATGYQWYWGYTYPDNGGFEVISNMMDENEALRSGLPPQLAVDNRVVVPAGEWLRIQVTAADVIHSWAVPSLWFKLDAVPGRLNEKRLFIEEPGIYYGQCSELCGVRHGYMPIAVEALPRPQWEAWIRSQGGTFGEEAEAPEIAPVQEPESAVPGAAGAGAPPTEDTAPTENTAPAQGAAQTDA